MARFTQFALLNKKKLHAGGGRLVSLHICYSVMKRIYIEGSEAKRERSRTQIWKILSNRKKTICFLNQDHKY